MVKEPIFNFQFSSVRNSVGFTMIELLVVIGILGILSVVGMDNFFFSQKKARDAARKSDLANIAKAVEMFQNDKGSYPIGQGGLIKGCDTGSGLTTCTWDGKSAFQTQTSVYMARVPQDPTTGQSYYYVSDGITFGLYAALENNKDAVYRGDIGAPMTCGSGVSCTYYVSQNGVEIP